MTKREQIWQRLHGHEAEIFGFIKNAVGNGDIARDLCQDVYLQAARNLDRLQPERSLKNWLVTVARNRVINYFRERQRRSYEPLAENLLTSESRTQIADQAFRHALNRLSSRQKQVFILRELEGLNYAELARQMKLSVAAVTSLLKRARERLSRNYLLYFLPGWFERQAAQLDLNDLARFINAFEEPEFLLARIQEKSQGFFNAIRDQWESIRKEFIPDEIFDQILAGCGPFQGKKVLDMGSGTGFVSIKSASLGAAVTGIDINPRMLDYLRTTRQNLQLDNLKLVRADIKHLPVRSGSFDLIFLTLVLHHLARPNVQLQQAAALLNPGGRLVLVDFQRHGNKELADRMHDIWLGFDQERIKKWGRSCGLRQVAAFSWNTPRDLSAFYHIYEKMG